VGSRIVPPRCHVCRRRALRWLERRGRFLCDSCGSVLDFAVVERHNSGRVSRQTQLDIERAQHV
jgi:hypothetical protein